MVDRTNQPPAARREILKARHLRIHGQCRKRMKTPMSPLSSLSRRAFLSVSAVACVTAPALARGAAVGAAKGSVGAKKHTIGLELYSVRGELGRDLPKTLKTVASIGYEVVEFYSP